MKLFVFGLGYSSLHFINQFGASYSHISGTVRSAEKALALKSEGVETLVFSQDHTDPAVVDAMLKADALLISVPPGVSIDPVLQAFGRKIGQSRAQKIVYLSTVGVYGDHDGAWVDEETVPNPASERSVARFKTEKAWIAAISAPRQSLQILRLAGIYGPGKNALVNLKTGTARRLIKPGQVFNRIHVEDIARAIAAAFAFDGPSALWNVSDDEPAPPQDVVAYAAQLMNLPCPPDIPFETADLSPMARSFYGENKRVSNRALRDHLGVELKYPTYRQGFDALFADGEGQ